MHFFEFQANQTKIEENALFEAPKGYVSISNSSATEKYLFSRIFIKKYKKGKRGTKISIFSENQYFSVFRRKLWRNRFYPFLYPFYPFLSGGQKSMHSLPTVHKWFLKRPNRKKGRSKQNLTYKKRQKMFPKSSHKTRLRDIHRV